LLPALVPFTAHWYTGAEPPLVGVAVNVTDVPGQIELALAEMLTAGVTSGTTLNLIVFDVAVGVLLQIALLVNTQLIISPVLRLLLV